MLDTIREGHKTTPLLVAAPILCPIHEDTPGPSAPVFPDGATHALRGERLAAAAFGQGRPFA
jgi:hypothetical protein